MKDLLWMTTILKRRLFQRKWRIIFPDPNAPTGVELPLQDIEEILKANPGSVVIVDEAYIDFGHIPALRFDQQI